MALFDEKDEHDLAAIHAFELSAYYKPLEQLLAVMSSVSNYVLPRTYHGEQGVADPQ